MLFFISLKNFNYLNFLRANFRAYFIFYDSKNPSGYFKEIFGSNKHGFEIKNLKYDKNRPFNKKTSNFHTKHTTP